jgi:DNA gyrase/topoisomerase IV subunit A
LRIEAGRNSDRHRQISRGGEDNPLTEVSVINQDKIDEWIREVEERPISAPIILRYIASRLKDLAAQNEDLRTENYQLRSGNKVDDYESRIANLEYQIALLKRQVSGQMSEPAAESISVLVYHQEGQALRVEVPVVGMTSNQTAVVFQKALPESVGPIRLLVAGPHEELLFVFDSGRTAAVPVTAIPTVSRDALDWDGAYLQEPVGSEKLAVVVPVARMSLAESIVQSTLRGCVKRMMRTFFESQLAKNYIGTGVKQQPDKACGLTLCGKDELFTMVSREGFLFSMEATRLPFSIEDAMKLRATDYIMSSFSLGSQDAVVIVTHNGKIIHRDFNWVEPAVTFKSRGQALFSQSRRDAGIKVAGAASVHDNDWGAALHQDGRITLHRMSDLFAAGSIPSQEGEAAIVDFAVFAAPESGQD